MMERYLNTGIKELITKFPKVADILNEYNIGCVPCNVGTCLFKDVVEIHNLAKDQEQELITRIARVIYPDRDIKIPKLKRQAKPKELEYSPPLQKLVDEHVLIKRWLTLIPKVIENLALKSEEDRKLILEGVDFISSYADKYHHAKEEDILFKYFDEHLDILKTMLIDHDTGRNHVRAIVEGVKAQDKDAVIEHLNGYKELLTEHIKKEDEILYPWMERNLSLTQIGEIFSKFNEVDKKTGEVMPKKYEKFIAHIEEKLRNPQTH